MIGEKHMCKRLLRGSARLCLAVAVGTLLVTPTNAIAGEPTSQAPFTLADDRPPPSGDEGVAPPEEVPEKGKGDGSSEDDTESYSEPEDPGFGGCQFDRRPLELMV